MNKGLRNKPNRSVEPPRDLPKSAPPTGKILYSPASKHRCVKPVISWFDRDSVGTIFRCECGKLWKYYGRSHGWQKPTMITRLKWRNK